MPKAPTGMADLLASIRNANKDTLLKKVDGDAAAPTSGNAAAPAPKPAPKANMSGLQLALANRRKAIEGRYEDSGSDGGGPSKPAPKVMPKPAPPAAAAIAAPKGMPPPPPPGMPPPPPVPPARNPFTKAAPKVAEDDDW
jgi:hypothetical protein